MANSTHEIIGDYFTHVWSQLDTVATTVPNYLNLTLEMCSGNSSNCSAADDNQTQAFASTEPMTLFVFPATTQSPYNQTYTNVSDIERGGGYVYGSVVNYTCDLGFRFLSNLSIYKAITCLETEQWQVLDEVCMRKYVITEMYS